MLGAEFDEIQLLFAAHAIKRNIAVVKEDLNSGSLKEDSAATVELPEDSMPINWTTLFQSEHFMGVSLPLARVGKYHDNGHEVKNSETHDRKGRVRKLLARLPTARDLLEPVRAD